MNRPLNITILLFLLLSILSTACKDQGTNPDNGEDVVEDTVDNGGDAPEDTTAGPTYPDDYTQWADFGDRRKWGPYNVHDPSCIADGEWTYCFSTDVAYGGIDRVGIQVRRSKDLVDWEFYGWVFNGIPNEARSYVTEANDGTAPDNMWAPYIQKAGDTYRLYYSVSVFGSSGSCIGLATSSSLDGTWEDQGIVLKSAQSDNINAIDPSVIVDRETEEYWMAYGSWSSGLYITQLNPETGMLKSSGDFGKAIARRSRDALEAPEVIYNDETDKYFLFVSYGELGDEYNVRVGRADQPDGPYLDRNGNDMVERSDNRPILITPYKFDNHPGWQGTGHTGVFKRNDTWFMMNQGRLASNSALMVMHLRELTWTDDGWPVAYPERYADIEQRDITTDSIAGTWERIVIDPTGGGSTKNRSTEMELLEGGEIKDASGSWNYDGDTLTITKDGNSTRLHIKYGWDWENDVTTLIYTGLNDDGESVWGKQLKN